MKPATRFLVTGIVAVMVLSAAASWVTLRQVDQRAQVRSLERLKVAAIVEGDLQSNRISELQLRGAALAQDPAFVDYVTQSLIPNPQLGGAIDSVSISDLLRERRSGYDIAMVLDARGMPAASSGILLKEHASIRADPLVKDAISQRKPQQGVWVDHGQLLWVAVNPLMRGGALQGALLVATRVDKSFAVAIARISGTDIALLIEPAPGSEPSPTSGLDGWTDQALNAQLPQLLGVTDQHGKAVQITDGQHGLTAWVTPVRASGGRAALVALDADGGAAPMDASALPLLFGVLGFGIGALLLVLLHWWRTWRPLQRMLDVIEHATEGDRNLTIRVEGSAMVRRLRDGIHRWLRAGG